MEPTPVFCSMGSKLSKTLVGKMYQKFSQHLKLLHKPPALEQLPDSQKTINVDLYCDLITTDARRIGNRHNLQAETLPLSFTDKVRQARRLLYEMAELEEDDDPPKTTPANFPKWFQSEMAMDHKVLKQMIRYK